tara:strand:- start:2022 stop:2237 length:216 start_codon:yes stop_codon:yes gene_type:complete
MYEVKKINQVFQLMKGNDVIGVFRSEVALEDAIKRLEAEQKPAPVEKPKKAKKVKKEKKVEKNVRKTDMDA